MNRLRLLATLFAVALAAPAFAADEQPGVFKIPGTDSTIKFYGYIQLDNVLDLSGRPDNYEGNDWATDLPGIPADNSNLGKHKKPQLYMTARQSRFGLLTTTPSDWGPITVKLEGDFNGPNPNQGETFTNSVLFRLRQAYGQVGGFLAGQTWGTFVDLGAFPDTVDFNPTGDCALIRNPMVRYTFGLAPGATLAVALENAPASRFGGSNFQTIPNVVAALNYAGSWGHVNVRGVTQTYNKAVGPEIFDPALGVTTAFADASPKSTTVVGFGVSGDFKIAGDTLVWQFQGGPGIGRYIYNLNPTSPFYVQDSSGNLKVATAYGAHVGYTHVWNKSFRSNLIGAYTWVVDPKIDGVETPAVSKGVPNQKDFIQANVNTFWTFAKNAELGAEYVYGQWKSFTGEGTDQLKGTQNRINVSLHYNFY
jgi:hypothetical protein